MKIEGIVLYDLMWTNSDKLMNIYKFLNVNLFICAKDVKP